MTTLRQLIKEFWLPLVIAICWAFYNSIAQDHVVWSTIKFVNIFGPTFFLISWLTAQYFRVRKQNKVESNLQNIQDRIGSLVQDLEEKTHNLIGHLTGGESFCYLTFNPGKGNSGCEIVIHHGEYSLFEVAARIVDLDIFDQVSHDLSLENIKKSQIHRSYGNLVPGYCLMRELWSFENILERRLNVFWTARNGGFTQLLRFKKVSNQWYSAIRVSREKIIFELIQDGFPRNENGEVNW